MCLDYVAQPERLGLESHAYFRGHAVQLVNRLRLQGLLQGRRAGVLSQAKRVINRGVATRAGALYQWIDLDEELFVIQITRTFNADGSTSAPVQVSNVDDQAVNAATVIYDQASQVNSINRAAG